MRLSRNRLSGALNAGFQKLVELTEVDLSGNCFSGLLHNLFDQCSKLQTLQLQENDFSGFLPNSIEKMSHLQILYVHNNAMRGTIPEGIGACVELRRLNLSNNQFRACLPLSIGNLVNLECLILEGNAIAGPVPRSISNLTKLKDFSCFKVLEDTLHMAPRRGFCKKEWERQYIWAPTQGHLNNLIWENVNDESLPNYPNPCRDRDDREAVWLFGKRSALSAESAIQKLLDEQQLLNANKI